MIYYVKYLLLLFFLLLFNVTNWLNAFVDGDGDEMKLSHYLQSELNCFITIIVSHIFYMAASLTISIFLSLSHSLLSNSGQITQWNLIFHGTSDPPQKNDPPRYGGNNRKTAVNDLIHNSLENSQWGFITQDVSENISFLAYLLKYGCD